MRSTRRRRGMRSMRGPWLSLATPSRRTAPAAPRRKRMRRRRWARLEARGAWPRCARHPKSWYVTQPKTEFAQQLAADPQTSDTNCSAGGGPHTVRARVLHAPRHPHDDRSLRLLARRILRTRPGPAPILIAAHRRRLSGEEGGDVSAGGWGGDPGAWVQRVQVQDVRARGVRVVRKLCGIDEQCVFPSCYPLRSDFVKQATE